MNAGVESTRVEADIARLKALMGVRSDGALAAALRITKSNVSVWKRRGRVSSYAIRRAELMAEHGQVPAGDSMERIAAEIALLHHRLADTRLNPKALAADLAALAKRARALGRDA